MLIPRLVAKVKQHLPESQALYATPDFLQDSQSGSFLENKTLNTGFFFCLSHIFPLNL